MKDFSKDTKDCIEQLYRNKILENFPLYGVFWNQFIDVRTDKRSRHLRPYGLAIPVTLKHREKEIKKTYLTICQVHYTLFCHLAGAHYQLKMLNKSLSIKNNDRKHFIHWETFEVIYLHFGIVRNLMFSLWGLFFILEEKLTKKAFNDIKKVSNELMNLLRLERKKYLFARLKLIENEVIALRNNIAHFARGACKSLLGKYYIPLRIKKNALWYEQFKMDRIIETCAKASQDLRNIENLLNCLHEFLIDRLSKYLIRKRIRVKYQKGDGYG